MVPRSESAAVWMLLALALCAGASAEEATAQRDSVLFSRNGPFRPQTSSVIRRLEPIPPELLPPVEPLALGTRHNDVATHQATDWPAGSALERPPRLPPTVQFGPISPGWTKPPLPERLPIGIDGELLASFPSDPIRRLPEHHPAPSMVLLASLEEVEPLPAPTPEDYPWQLRDSPASTSHPATVTLTPLAPEPAAPVVTPPPAPPVAFPFGDVSARAARLGYWSVDYTGSPVKVGEFQSLEPSPFLDLDGLHTNGLVTWDYRATLLDDDAPQADFRFYAPNFKASLDYQGYLRRLDRDPYEAYVDFDQQPTAPLPPAPGNFRDMKEDQTVGEDFAIRVQQLDTRFAGRLTDHVNWRLDLWGMRKHGERQAAAVAHCFTAPNATDVNGNPVGGNACHVLSQSQRIDWLTAEIKPAVEACYGPVTVEYSRTMRSLTTDDQLVTRPYDRLGFSGEQPYDIVPENYTEIDRLKFGLRLANNRDGYARVYSGQTHNRFRDTDRDFRGFDLRFTDQSISGLTLTGYVKNYVQRGEYPSVLIDFETPGGVRTPINYDRTTAGFNTTWRPFYGEQSLRGRLRLGSGYEYAEIDRENAVFVEQAVTADNSFTKSNNVHFRASMNWTPLFESYVRYRISFIDNPLYAAPIDNTAVNTSLPTQLHSVRFGNTWSPTHNFFLHGMMGINNSWNHSDIADFDEERYDLVFTAWYAPLPRWSLSGGLGFYSNWIDQDITLGSKSDPATLPWDYGGRSDVVNFGTTFDWTERLTISGTLDFVRGRNAFDPVSLWPDLWTYSDVNAETTRFGVGFDYALSPCQSLYFRYQLFDYDAKSNLADAGTADFFLVGGSFCF